MFGAQAYNCLPMGKDGLLIEDLDTKFDAVIELVGQMRNDMKGLAKQEDLEEVKADVKAIKAALTDTNIDLINHDKRITFLEQAA